MLPGTWYCDNDTIYIKDETGNYKPYSTNWNEMRKELEYLQKQKIIESKSIIQENQRKKKEEKKKTGRNT